MYIVRLNIVPPRVILSEGRSPQSNPEGVCVAQDLRGANKIWWSVRDPATSCRATRSTPLRSAQDNTDGCVRADLVINWQPHPSRVARHLLPLEKAYIIVSSNHRGVTIYNRKLRICLAFSCGRRCHDEGVTDEEPIKFDFRLRKSTKIIHFCERGAGESFLLRKFPPQKTFKL